MAYGVVVYGVVCGMVVHGGAKYYSMLWCETGCDVVGGMVVGEDMWRMVVHGERSMVVSVG